MTSSAKIVTKAISCICKVSILQTAGPADNLTIEDHKKWLQTFANNDAIYRCAAFVHKQVSSVGILIKNTRENIYENTHEDTHETTYENILAPVSTLG